MLQAQTERQTETLINEEEGESFFRNCVYKVQAPPDSCTGSGFSQVCGVEGRLRVNFDSTVGVLCPL